MTHHAESESLTPNKKINWNARWMDAFKHQIFKFLEMLHDIKCYNYCQIVRFHHKFPATLYTVCCVVRTHWFLFLEGIQAQFDFDWLIMWTVSKGWIYAPGVHHHLVLCDSCKCWWGRFIWGFERIWCYNMRWLGKTAATGLPLS